MLVHFEYPSGVTQQDVSTFLANQEIEGTWFDWELNVFRWTGYTMEENVRLTNLCITGFMIEGVPVRGYILDMTKM